MEKKKTRVLSNVLFMLRYVLKFTPGYFWNLVLTAILFQVEVFFEFTYCTKYLLDLLQFHGTFQQALQYMLFVAVMVLIKIVWAALLTHKIAPKAKEKLHKELQEELYRQAVRLDLARYDDPDCYNEFVFSVSEVGIRVDQLLSNIEGLCIAVTGIVTTGIFFLNYDVIGILFIVISLAISYGVNQACARLQFEMDKELKPIQRKRNYFSRLFYLSDYAKEIRLYPVADKFKQEFQETNEQVEPIVNNYGTKQFRFQLLNEASEGIIIGIAYMGYLLYQAVVKGLLSYGSVLGLSDAAHRLKRSLRRLTELAAMFRQDSFYIDKIREFLSFEPEIIGGERKIEAKEVNGSRKKEVKVVDVGQKKEAREVDGGREIEIKEFEGLDIQNISFGYQADKPILKDINMQIKPGEKIAIVGYNGAGKTTLIKVLMRLYDVNSGRILLNGYPIKEYDVENYRSLFGSVFQDYKLYGATLAENVKMDLVKDGDARSIQDALIRSGFGKKLAGLEQGLDTNLTREFDDEGINLSGGEAQKVAIARAFYQNSPIILLDEPSSALDPVSEYYLNEAMLRAAEHKTVIFISHRLSTAQMADRIYMLEKGRIVEQGSHSELMELGGKYAEMYHMQADKYRDVQFG